jgi:hypothetical protein
MAMDKKYGAEITDISCTRVQVGVATLPDGTTKPIFEPRPQSPKAYRRLIDIVTNKGRHVSER